MSGAYTAVPFGRYVLLEKIAVGGMAEIFKAQYRADKDFEKVLVIKRILPNLASNEDFITMFRDEAKVNVRLTHANIVQVFDFGREGNDYYLAMEYVQGQNLRRVLKRAGEVGSAALPIPFALYIAQETAKGLAYAHTRKDNANKDLNIIHRDVTPSNILVSYEGEVKITDFGIAKATSKTGSTQAGMVKGKAPYLAPEQLNPAKTPDARLDVFALGAVTWELLTGRRLVPGETDMEVLGHLMNARAFPKPSEVKPSIPAEVDRIVMKALERDPDQRYATAAAYQKELAVLVSRYGITSTEASTLMHRLFKPEIEAEASKSMQMPVVDAGMVTQGAEQEATRTQQSKAGHPGYAETATTPIGQDRQDAKAEKATAFVTPSKPHSPAAPPAKRSFLLPGIGIGALAAAGLVLAATQPWNGADVRPAASPAPIVSATVSAVAPTPAATATPTVAPVASATATVARARTPRPGTPAPTATMAPPAATPTKVALPSGKPGFLTIDSKPCSGKIYLNGADTGRETPAFNMPLPSGSHTIRVYCEVQRLEASLPVEVRPGETTKMGVIQLKPK